MTVCSATLAIWIPPFIERGGVTMWVLLACSLVALTFIFERAAFWIGEASRRNNGMTEKVIGLAQQGDLEGAQSLAASSRDFVLRMLAYGLSHREASVGDSLELAAGAELKRMKRFLPILDTIITVAPLLGILGTVIGIIDSFDVLGAGSVHDPKLVVPGIAKALTTTVAGLIISIASLVPYNYFLSRVENAAGEMNHRGTQLEILIRKGGGSDAD